MSLLQFPAQRQQYSGIDNPLYVSDIVLANQGILDAITAIAGLGPTDFAIFGGLQYMEAISGANYYTPGFFYLNGVWYYQAEIFDENEYLAPNITGELPYTFTDATERNLYDINFGQAVVSSSPSTSPQFIGNMNGYRLDSKTLYNQVQQLFILTNFGNIQVPVMPTTLTISFSSSNGIFVANTPTSGDYFLTFDFTGAIPGAVSRLKLNCGAISFLEVTVPAGSDVYADSGSLTDAPNNLNIMYFTYAGINELGNHEVSYTISQV